MSFYYGPYVRVAEKTRIAKARVRQLQKAGVDVHPIEAFKGAIATTFWGKSWCDNLTSYADFENRISRGRSYIRNGLICDLHIERGALHGIVSGSTLYHVDIAIEMMKASGWEALCNRVQGQIGSLMDLLQGKFSKNLMTEVCNPDYGLFPKPSEMELSCSCPDWAKMCKHVTACLYAVGRLLDTKPECLFTLRGVDASDLFAAADLDVPDATDTAFDGTDMGELFGIDLEEEEPAKSQQKSKKNKSNV
ncbi:MAG: hypothetical protein IJS54_02350 [Desulfovibrio sp.]|nr:hypothetical protein [Desulfovibrio sp.]